MNTDTFFTTGTSIIRQAIQADSLEDFERALQLYIKGINYFVKGLKYLTPGSKQKLLYSGKCNEYMVRAETIKTTLKERNNAPDAGIGGTGGGGGTSSDSEKSRLRSSLLSSVVKQGEVNVKWDDIAGLDQAKAVLKEALVYPTLYPDMNIVPWKGILFYGSGGTGKTALARAVATELNSYFLSISSSDLVSKWHGESEKLIAELFDLARSNKPSVIFIDEIDSLCSSRGDEDVTNARIVTQFLKEMDGIGKNNTDVTIIGATNRPWVIDDAIRRRFEKRVYIPLPDSKAREDLFRIKLKDKKINLGDAQFTELAALTDGYSGADIDILIRDVCMTPMRRLSKAVYFKKDDQGYDVPCQSTDLGAEKKNLSMGGLKIDNTIKYEYFTLSLEKVKPSVSQQDLERFVNWTDQFGESGN